MRHQKAGRKLGRTTSHRNAMFRNMLASFFEREKIETTTVKAKELRPLAEKLITLGKRGDLHSRRRVLRLIPDRKVVHKLFNEIASRFESRVGGYTRIIRIGYRAGDNAPMSIIELVTDETVTGKKKGKKKKKIPAQAKPEVKTEAVEATTPEKEKVSKDLSLEKSVEEKQAGDKGGEESPQVQKNTPSVSEEKESGGEGSGSEATSGDESRESSEKTE